MKDLRNLTYKALKEWDEGTFKGGVVETYGSAEGGVALPMETSKWKNFSQEDYDALYERLAKDEDGIASSIPSNTDYDDPSQIPLERTKITYVQ